MVSGSSSATWSRVRSAVRGGAELVGGVGDELALGLERGLEPGEQAVEGVPEFLELVVGALEREAFIQARRGDSPSERF